MDLALAIEAALPGADYGGSVTADHIERAHGGDAKAAFDALEWRDKRDKPKFADVVAAHDALPAPRVRKSPSVRIIEKLQAKGVIDAVEAAELKGDE